MIAMQWIHRIIKWIMFVSGVLTATMFYAAIAPAAALRSTFGESLEGDLAEIVVRNWGLLVGMIGALLIFGAFRGSYRRPILLVAILTKTAFIGLVLTYGNRFLGNQAGIAIAIDAVAVTLFALYLIATGRSRDHSRM
jgi:hypothetical protein